MQLLLSDDYLWHKREYGGTWKEDSAYMPRTSVSLLEDPIFPFLTVSQNAIQATLTNKGNQKNSGWPYLSRHTH